MGQAINFLKLRAVVRSLLSQDTFDFELICLDSHIVSGTLSNENKE